MLLPEDSLPIDAFHTSDRWRITFPTSLCPPIDTPFAFPTFPEYLNSLPDHERCAILRYNLLGSTPYDFTHALSNLDDIILVSNGGARDDYGSYGWVFSHQNGMRLAQGQGSVFRLDPKSYRAKISGCHAALLFLHHSFKYCNTSLPPGTLQIHCDNEGFVKKINCF
jgi:hypothetical protein